MDTSETVTGKRGRASAEGAMDSDTPTQSADKKRRKGDLHLACIVDKEVAEEPAPVVKVGYEIEDGFADSAGSRGVVYVGRRGARVICVGCGRAQPNFGAGIDGMRKAYFRGPGAQGEAERIR